ncbi:MAG: hypothetical protein HY856_13660 [Burkholderiales bacterium]|nr:hypothetical protein [Burkholderiales bacterium]
MPRIPLVSHDKANHSIYGFLIYLAAAFMALGFGAESANAALVGFLAASAAAWGKELYDRRASGTYDPDDATATMVGGAAGAAATTAPSLMLWLRAALA